MERVFIRLGAGFGFLAVLLGAFGAHALKSRATPDELAAFETGARYQMFHALALFACAFSATRLQPRLVAVAGSAFVVGILLFCSSLYAIGVTGTKGFGAVTPFGGVAFLVGWAALALAAFSRSSSLPSSPRGGT